MATWTAFPYDATPYTYDAAALRLHWPRLHAGDAEPLPQAPAVLDAWRLFHAGAFRAAVDAGLAAHAAGHADGMTAANKAQAVYATYLAPTEQAKRSLLLELAGRAEAQAAATPRNPNAHYLMAYALGRYSQGASIAKALAEGVGAKLRAALETAIELAPLHADAHVALGAFHAEVIDKVGALLGRAQGASRDAGLALFKRALKLNPDSALAMVEYANGMVMLEGEKRAAEATQLYEAAMACVPMDAAEHLDVEMARVALDS